MRLASRVRARVHVLQAPAQAQAQAHADATAVANLARRSWPPVDCCTSGAVGAGASIRVAFAARNLVCTSYLFCAGH